MQQSERPAVTKQITMSLDCEADRFLRAHVSQRQMGRYISQLLMFEKMTDNSMISKGF